MSGEANDPGQLMADDAAELPTVADPDVDGRDEADDEDEADPSPKNDVPTAADDEPEGGP